MMSSHSLKNFSRSHAQPRREKEMLNQSTSLTLIGQNVLLWLISHVQLADNKLV